MRFYPLLFLLWLSTALAAPAPVLVVPVEGAIGPATADFVHRGLAKAAREGAQLVVLRMDTPGGLDSAMRRIVKDILASPVPVAGFVAPSGSRAASAGTFILYACHIAAMAPGTNLGAASPVSIGGIGGQDEKKGGGGTEMRKVMNDAIAYIRGLAELRGRNAEWAERAVREAVSLPANEAVKIHVVDLEAAGVPELLKQLDGRSVRTAAGARTLETAGAPVKTLQVDWRTRFLGTITDPSVAYILVLLGVYAVLFELLNPGMVLPGVTGVIAIVIAGYAFHLLPVNYAGLALIVLGIGFMVAEAFLPAFGSLGIGGLIAFVLGSILLFDSGVPGFGLPWGLIAGVAAASAGFLIFVVGMIVKGQRRRPVSGREQMLGATAEALGDFEGEGWARVHGESWRVRSAAPVRRGERLRVVAMEGLVLTVVPDNVKGG